MKCKDISEAHRLSAMIFGLEKPYHFRSDKPRESDSMNMSLYDEDAVAHILKPRIRTYREKTERSAISERSREKKHAGYQENICELFLP